FDPSNGLPNGHEAFLWSSVSVFPGSGDALAAGRMRPAASGGTPENDGRSEPVLARVGCDGAVTTTRFRDLVPNGGASAPPRAPADREGYATAGAANAATDAWAATSEGTVPRGGFGLAKQRPHLYRLTDAAQPDAPAGDDEEERPVITAEDPPIFVEEPPPP